MTRKNSTFIKLLALVLLCPLPAGAEALFPQPPELQRDVDFWVSIFTRYDSDEGVLHDNRNLAIVYGQVDVGATVSRRTRNRVVNRERKEIQQILRSLASGKRDDLSTGEARILALFGAGVSNAELRQAAGRIRYQQGLADRFREGLVRSGRWRTYIEQRLEELGVPIELAALPHVESSYNPNARSHVGASGIWQFTRSTGRRFMRIDHVIDERNDPFAASGAAAELLAYNYSIAGNWPMAITAYNHGLSGARRAMKQFGEHSYTEILRNYKGRTFGFASRNFYVAFLAAMEVDQNRQKYFADLVLDEPVEYERYQLLGFVAAKDLGAALGVSTRQLARYNPALQPTVWQGSKHLPMGFEIRIPAELLDTPINKLMQKIPESSWFDEQLPDLFHTVARGDTLSQIAKTYKTRVSTLVALNNLSSSHRIRAGQQIRLPAAGPAPVTTRATATESEVVASVSETAAADAPLEEVTPPVLAETEVSASTAQAQTALLSDPSDYSVAADGTIEVQELETLGHFADWLGIRTQRLRDVNGMPFGRHVEVGRRISIDTGEYDAAQFESRRIAFHREQQDGFFRKHVITGIEDHVIRRGESIWVLASRRYGVPVWLFRQYNPGVDLSSVRPGTTVRFPILGNNEAS